MMSFTRFLSTLPQGTDKNESNKRKWKYPLGLINLLQSYIDLCLKKVATLVSSHIQESNHFLLECSDTSSLLHPNKRVIIIIQWALYNVFN